MKKILVTGKNSYIGDAFEKWMAGDQYQIDKIDLKDPNWREMDFSSYDVVFHVAGIAHADVSKVSEETKQLYYKVNTNLTEETAMKYKKDREGRPAHFIFMSSIIIYGEETSVNKKRIITSDTLPNPSNFYGDSKLQAEHKLEALRSTTFKIAILRPPMIYGPGSKGNYQQLTKLAMKLPFFPNVKNERSMLYIDHLNAFLKDIIDEGASGVFFPQDEEYVCTSQLVKKIAVENGKNIILLPGTSWVIKLLGYIPGKIGRLTNKAFGNLVYEKNHISETREYKT